MCELIGHAQTTNTSELNAAGSSLFGQQWGGAVDARGVQSRHSGPSYTIVNTLAAGDPASTVGHGGHWCGLHEASHRRILYDTYARSPRQLFPHWPRIDTVETTDNTDREQRSIVGFGDDHEDRFCGQACLAWLLLCRESVPAAKMI